MKLPEISDELLARLAVAGPRYTSYPTVLEWRPSFDAAHYEGRLEVAALKPDEPLSLYVHLPFCRELCSYCGCNVVVSKSSERADAYLDTLTAEIALAAERLGERRTFAQLHWGGGTPTFLTEAQIQRLFGEIRKHFTPARGAEIAIEIDPVVTTDGQLRLLRKLGFNRLSLGVQDFDERVQKAVRRIQTVEETAHTLNFARELGYGGINFDLIYGLPFQTRESWTRTLEAVMRLRPDRAATYAFAYVPEARTNQRVIPREALPNERARLGLLMLTHETFAEAGYQSIGMDHFALAGDELSVAQRERRLWRNFQGYTVKRGTDSVGFGATAISEVQGAFAQNVRPLPTYDTAIRAGRLATERGYVMTADDVRRREIITELMCHFRVDFTPEQARHFAPELERARTFVDDGLVAFEGLSLCVTPLGRLFVRNIAMCFDAYLQQPGERHFSKAV